MTRRLEYVLVGAAATALSACSATSPASPTPIESPLRLVSVSPGSGATLTRGARVAFGLTVTSQWPGRLTLSVEDQSRTSLLASTPVMDVVAGREASLGAAFDVSPSASSIHVVATLRPTDSAHPAAAVFVDYGTGGVSGS